MSEKSVVWVHSMGPQMASFRYRTQMPATEVAKHNGFKTAINGGDADIVVFSKPTKDDFPIAEKAKLEGAKIVVDLADDHFQRDDTYKKYAELADAIVCASDVMRARIYDYTKKHAVSISDPYEVPECAPHADGDQLLWFGHQVNMGALLHVLPLLKDRPLRVVTGPKPAPNCILWSPENLMNAFAASNTVILPVKRGDEHKSPNRLINSLRAGCFVVTMEHPSYDEFKRFIWAGKSPSGFPTGLRWMDAFRSDLNDLVKAGQDYIRDKYSPTTIGAQWASFLESV